MNKPINIQEQFFKFSDFWSPHIIGQINDTFIKVAKLKGSFTWHSHAKEDELFFIIKGNLRIEFENKSVNLKKGDLFVVPKGVLHNPVAKKECHVLLIEKTSTKHMGKVKTSKTKSVKEQLRKL